MPAGETSCDHMNSADLWVSMRQMALTTELGRLSAKATSALISQKCTSKCGTHGLPPSKAGVSDFLTGRISLINHGKRQRSIYPLLVTPNSECGGLQTTLIPTCALTRPNTGGEITFLSFWLKFLQDCIPVPRYTQDSACEQCGDSWQTQEWGHT